MIGTVGSFRRKLLDWYERSRRDLPWRLPIDAAATAQLDPYRVLVSEAMLQQTTVAAVVPYFTRFINRFPTVHSLADADEQDVLRLWQGLGYYSRARNLQKAARTIVERFDGAVPSTVDQLLTLPGVGRYTAGAIASIAFERRAPIVDGNVARVLCRIDQIETDPRERTTQERLWSRAEQILPRRRIGDFNSALMELGATVCTPRSPQCLICPVRAHCEAVAAGVQDRIPAARKARPTPLLRRAVLCVQDQDRWLIEQRPARGRWAGMWQFVTVEAPASAVTARTVRAHLSLTTDRPRRIGTVHHSLTHRRYEFDVYRCALKQTATDLSNGLLHRWVTASELDAFPLPRPHVKVAELLHGSTGNGAH